MEPELSGTLPQKSSFLGTPETELDLPPEHCHYRDEGCELADSCLNCPLPKCIYDQPRGRQRWLKSLRDREIVRLASSEGKGIKELALRFGVSQRTVQRILKNSLSTLSPVSPSPLKGMDIKKRGEAPLKLPCYQGEGEDGCSDGLRPSVTASSQPSERKNKERGVASLNAPNLERTKNESR